MSEGPGRAGVVTPEAVALSVDVAGIGSRMIAAIIDFAIQAAIGVGVGVILGASGTEVPFVVGFVLLFLLIWAYFPLWEGLWGGRTPGKRAQRLRVVQVDGQPATWGGVIARNLLRIVDFLPVWYLVGTVAIIVSKRSQRLGDLAARTVVVRESRPPAPVRLELSESAAATAIDTSSIGEEEYALVRAFLQRRASLRPQARAELARQLVSAILVRLGSVPEPRGPDEELLEAVAVSYRRRSGAR